MTAEDPGPGPLFFELFSGLPRQGPGDTTSTLRALALVPTPTAATRILDLGCGTGAQTLVLAAHTPAHIVALDTHPPFVEALAAAARERGLAARLEARVGDMRRLDLPPASFDLIWSEGALYNIGFEAGLRALRPLLKPQGYLALTEAAWLTDSPSPECRAFWDAEYPAIRDSESHLRLIRATGYEDAGHFVLPASSWWDEYYAPLELNIACFRERHAAEAEASALAASVQHEIDVWRRYSAEYSYVFYVMRRDPATPAP